MAIPWEIEATNIAMLLALRVARMFLATRGLVAMKLRLAEHLKQVHLCVISKFRGRWVERCFRGWIHHAIAGKCEIQSMQRAQGVFTDIRSFVLCPFDKRKVALDHRIHVGKVAPQIF